MRLRTSAGRDRAPALDWDVSGAREPEELTRLAAEEELPYHRLLRLVYRVVGDGHASVELPDLAELHDEEDAIHRGAVFGAADVTNGLAYLGALGSDAYTTGLVVQGAQVRWERSRPGRVTLEARLPMSGRELLARLDSERRFSMRAAVVATTAAGERLGLIEFDYYVRRMITGRRLQLRA